MINLVDYQSEAVEKLIKAYKELLFSGNQTTQIVLKSPTGSGKTVMLASMLDEILNEVPDDIETVFVWASMNKLHIQSRDKLANQYLPDSEYKLMLLENMDDQALEKNSILFCNWESLFKTKTDSNTEEISWDNVFVRIGETGRNLQNVMDKTREAGRRIVLIVDEAHRTYLGPNSQRLVNEIIQPNLTIEASATPLLDPRGEDVEANRARTVTVSLASVRASGLIKDKAIINNHIGETAVNSEATDLVVLEAALAQRNDLVERYIKAGSPNVKPLILVQLPSEGEKLSELDETVRERVENMLAERDLTYQNHKLAIWLSNDKTNKELVDIIDSPVEVLIFKQAIATGWDCPRAQILVMLRDIKSLTFEIQTVGRIMRMPELKHYEDEWLNTAYIFTNINKVSIGETEDAQTYFKMQISKLRPDIRNIKLPDSWYSIRQERRRLGGVFREIMIDKLNQAFDINQNDSLAVRHEKVDKLLQIDPKELTIPILSNVVFEHLDEIDQKLFDDSEMTNFMADATFIQREFNAILRAWVSPYAPHDSVPVMRRAIYKWFSDNGFDDEAEIQRIITCSDESRDDANQKQLNAIVDVAKEEYGRSEGENKDFRQHDFVVPEIREFGENHIIAGARKHALFPFYRERQPWQTEKNFEEFIDSNSKVEWWFRNGVVEPKYFGVNQRDADGRVLMDNNFFPDYIVQFTDGTIGIFDTKSGTQAGNHLATASQENAGDKADALQAWIRDHKELGVWGGLITPRGNVWHLQKDAWTHTNASMTLAGSGVVNEPTVKYSDQEWQNLEF